MIKKISIKNIYGIKNEAIDFTIKNIRKSNEFLQIAKVNNEYISLIPTFLAKNATGKTSLVKAIKFATFFLTKKNLENFIFRNSYEVMMEESMRKSRPRNKGKSNKMEISDNLSIYFASFIKKTFEEVCYNEDELVSIDLELFDGKKIIIELSSENFILSLNKEIIDIGKLLRMMQINYLQDTFIELRNQIRNKAIQLINKINFFKNNNNYDTSAMVREYENIGFSTFIRPNRILINSSSSKLGQSMREIYQNCGLNFLKKLLQYCDKNIQNVTMGKNERIVLTSDQNNDVEIHPSKLSYGTKKIIEIISRSLKILKHGGIMMIDEIETGLHLSLIKLIVSLFETEEINQGKGQLLLTTHNPLLMEREIIEIVNVFLSYHNNFKHINDIPEIARTEDKLKILKSKNYYNELFWFNNKLSSNTTLNNSEIREIVSSFHNGE